MRAACYEETGAARKVLHIATLPDPVPDPGEVLVRVRWSGINPSDVKTRAGLRTSVLPFPRIIPHSDGMGTIVDVGAGVARSRIGERVWIWNAGWQRASGTAAELVALPARQAVPLPAGVADEVGACLGIPAMTALHAVLVDGGVEGKSVLIAGGAGAVGHYALQFARLLGARQLLTTVSTAEKQRIALEAGAETAIDYRKDDVRARVMEHTLGHGVNRLIEVDIAANGALDSDIVAAGGDLVVYGSGQSAFTLPFFPLILKHVRLRFFIVYALVQADRDREQAMLDRFLAGGQLRHTIAARLPLADIAAAHELVESGRAIGNVILQVT